ncbi:MAG: hypothetical protein JWR35_2605 [Marmoricola sp.]|jgi:hypothetical protein|nr:hypothetical protein [Marmoricola sp.]
MSKFSSVAKAAAAAIVALGFVVGAVAAPAQAVSDHASRTTYHSMLDTGWD